MREKRAFDCRISFFERISTQTTPAAGRSMGQVGVVGSLEGLGRVTQLRAEQARPPASA